MKKMAVCVIGAAAVAFAALGQQSVPSGRKSQAEKLYLAACDAREKKDLTRAIIFAARVVADHAQDTEWIAKAEWLCAELYFDLKMFASAEATARQIELLYPGTEFEPKAQALRAKINELKTESK